MKMFLDKDQMSNLIKLGYNCGDSTYEYVKCGNYERIGFNGIDWYDEAIKPKEASINCVSETIMPCYTLSDIYDKFEKNELNGLKHDRNGWKFTSIEYNTTLKETELIDLLYQLLIKLKISQ